MLDALADLIPVLRKSLLNDREKRVVAAVIIISLPLTMFFISFRVSSIILENRYARLTAQDEEEYPYMQRAVNAAGHIVYNAIELEALHSFLMQNFERGNLNKAEEVARLILRNVPDDDLSHFMMARINIGRQQFARATNIIGNLEKRNFMPDSLRTLRIMMASAADLPQLASDAHELSVTQLAAIAQRFMDLQNNAAARTFLDRALVRDSTNTDALFVAATWYISQKEFTIAERIVRKALEVDPTSSRILGRYAILLQETGRINQAVEAYVSALRRNPFDSDLMYRLGDLFLTELNDRNNARRYFLRTLELSPNSWEVYFKLGLISAQESDNSAAIEYFNRANGISPNNLRIMHLLAASHERNNERENALRIYRQILEINPLDDIALYKIRLLSADNRANRLM